MTYTEILFEPDAAGFVQSPSIVAEAERAQQPCDVRPRGPADYLSGAHAVSTGQEVLYVTEAAVFRLTADGLQLEEVAPGLDPERDVIAKMAFPADDGRFARHDARRVVRPALLPADCFPAFQ